MVGAVGVGRGGYCVMIVHPMCMLLCSSSIIIISFLVMVMQVSTTYCYITHTADDLTYVLENTQTHTSTHTARRGMMEKHGSIQSMGIAYCHP